MSQCRGTEIPWKYSNLIAGSAYPPGSGPTGGLVAGPSPNPEDDYEDEDDQEDGGNIYSGLPVRILTGDGDGI